MTLTWVIIIAILLALYGAACCWAIDRFYQTWEAEYADMNFRKNQTLEKRGPQPGCCPYCGEVIPPDLSAATNCSRCGRLVIANR